MSKPYAALNVGISVLIFFAVAYAVADFLMVDNCLDYGGRIDEITGDCETNGEHLSLLKKAGPMFWLFLLMVSIVPVVIFYWLSTKLLSNGK